MPICGSEALAYVHGWTVPPAVLTRLHPVELPVMLTNMKLLRIPIALQQGAMQCRRVKRAQAKAYFDCTLSRTTLTYQQRGTSARTYFYDAL